MDISKPKFEINEIVEVEINVLKELFSMAIKRGEMHPLVLEYALAYPLAYVKKIEQNPGGQWIYLLDFLDESVDYIFFKEEDLNPTGHFVKPNKFTSHEIVLIVNPSEKHKNFENFKGFVTGMSTDRNGMWSYGVDFLQNQFDCRDCICEEHELESTGEFVKKEDYYSGESVKVIVHPDGRGELKES